MATIVKARERRKKKRYRVHGSAFAVLNSNSRFTKLGSIIDISEGGLSFHYIDTRDHENASTEQKMDIFVSGHGFMIDQIPFQFVSELILPKEIPFYSVVTRRFGIRFSDMPPQKAKKIDVFIREHALEEPVPDTPA